MAGVFPCSANTTESTFYVLPQADPLQLSSKFEIHSSSYSTPPHPPWSRAFMLLNSRAGNHLLESLGLRIASK